MPAKKKRAAIAPSKKPAAKQTSKKPVARKAIKKAAAKKATRQAAPKKAAAKKATRQAAPKKAAPKKAAPKGAAPKKPDRNQDRKQHRKPDQKPVGVQATKKPAAASEARPVTQTTPPAAPAANKRPALPPDPTEELAQALAALALDKKADDVIILHVTDLTSYADFFVLASAPSDRQVQAIARFAAEELKKAGKAPLGTEGLEQGHWVLVDYGSVVLHVFLASARQYYDLEGFWSDAPAIDVDEARGVKALAARAAAAAEASARAADADESPAFAVNE